MEQIVEQIELALSEFANEKKAIQMKAYMKHYFEFYGVPSPQRKLILKEIWNFYQSEIKRDWRQITIALWNGEYRECQMVALEIMGKCKSDLKIEDFALLEYLVLNKSWWDTVDYLATNIAGKLMKDNPALIISYNQKWINNENMWLNRTAILFQLKYKEETDFDLLKSNILKHKLSKEFFINKASGWALRQYSKFNAKAVREFLTENPDLPKLTIREASKYI